MPMYTYRREDGTTFDYKQKFSDDPLTVDPESGQHVVRVVQAAGVIFKGSGFYINDSKSASKSSMTSASKTEPKSEKTESSTPAAAEAKPAAAPAETAKPAPASTTTAAD
jgi:putative FmdB family regulatory protein